jgi:hypothetical protein
MGRSSKAISLVLIGPALLGSTLVVSGCNPAREQVEDQGDWVAAADQDQGDSWGPPDPLAPEQHQGGTGSTQHSSHRSNVGGFIGGFLGARAGSSVGRSVGSSSAPSSGTSHFGGASARGGFGSSAGHSASS